MLIVNADDFGASRSATTPVIEAFAARRITSASAMVWMGDSARAAELAARHGLPLGLHLNLTAPFGDRDAPATMRRLQETLIRRFDRRSWHVEDLAAERDDRVQAAVDGQLVAFRECYGEPTHIDGHHHVHVHPAVLACLPRELPIRAVLTAPPRLGDPPSARMRVLHQRFLAPDGCIDFRHVIAALASGPGVLDFARHHILEVMVHPQQPAEREALLSVPWSTAIDDLELGSYRDLAARRLGSGRPSSPASAPA